MLTESNFPGDIRVRQEAELLTKKGHHVSVIALCDKGQKFCEEIKAVNVYRVPKIELFSKVGKKPEKTRYRLLTQFMGLFEAIIGYSFEYAYFTTACCFLSVFAIVRHRFEVIHTHNPPDTLFIVALFYKFFFGKKFVYDHHDLSPDLFVEKYSQKSKYIYNLLLLLERISCQSADIVIATNESYKAVEIQRCGVREEKIFVVRNGPNLNEMKSSKPIKKIRDRAKTILCYLGAINVQDGVDYVLDVLAKMIYKFNQKDVLLLVIGDGDHLPRIRELATELEIDDYVAFTGYIFDRQKLSRYLSSVDIFVDAAPYSFLNDKSTFIKHMEYMVYEKPVVSFALKESVFSLQDAGLFVPPNDTDQMAQKIVELMKDPTQCAVLGRNAAKRVKEVSWDRVSKPLIAAYEDISMDVQH